MVNTGRSRKTLSSRVLGHTKSNAAVMFAEIAHKFHKSDVFTTRELIDMVLVASIVVKEQALENN